MPRYVRNLLLGLVLATSVAAPVCLLPDPGYALSERLGGGRYWAYDEWIVQIARKRNVDPMLIKAIVWRETAFHPDKMGTSGERGLMQVGVAAATDWARAEKMETFLPEDLWDPKTNLEVGAWYFAKALERWKTKADPVPFALADYNAGRGRVDRWIAATGRGEDAQAEDLMRVIDFPTTRRYIEAITARYRFYKERGGM